MREIEFRGKTLGNRVDKSYWVYGGIAYAGGEAYIIKCYPLTHNYLGKHDTEIWEVIGNIHDNPELLCVKKTGSKNEK